MTENLKKTDQIRRYIDAFWLVNCLPPTIRDIQKGCNISSTSVVAYHLEILAASGYLTVLRNKARSITPKWVIRAIQQYPSGPQEAT